MWGTIGASLAIVALVAWVVSRHHSSTQFVFGLATVTAILVSYHALAHDLTLLVPIVLLSLARTLSATEWEIREDTILLVVLYTILWASAHWGWLSPLWCVPVLIWIFWKYDRGALSGRRCEPASP
jgi:hypothetical protein